MENQENNQDQEEIQNIDQFQINRSGGDMSEGNSAKESEEYTEDEIPFADGEGTQLNDEIGPEDEEDDESADLDEESVDDQEYNESDVEELDNDPNAYDKEDSEML